MWFCDECLRRVPRIEPPTCIRCGREIEPFSPRICSHCRTAPLEIERIRSAVYFEGTLREAVHKFKYEGLTVLAEPLGSLVVEGWSRHATPTDVLVPVPLHESHLRRRGFNQAALLTYQLANHVHLPVDEKTLIRHRATASQFRLATTERRENVSGAFRCVSDALSGQSVLLIDDVCTTGSTLDACAVALREGGAKRVEALTLARARF
jgi:ComF family protein